MAVELSIIKVEQTSSTNALLLSMVAYAESGTVVITDNQTAGRGQRGNTWEAEPGKNITMSLLFRPPNFKARYMFLLSEMVSVAIADVLQEFIESPQNVVSIKWPNDIYVNDKKICGILIENSIMGEKVGYSIVGIGLNVNQREFLSDAPNPVSLYNIIGQELDVDKLAEQICRAVLNEMSMGCENPQNGFVSRYKSMLWRRHGFHKYALPNGSVFEACLVRVNDTGELVLKDKDGNETEYAFKEVHAVL